MSKPSLESGVYAALRVMAGAMFAFHGAQKIFGLFATKPPPEVMSQLWIGGLIELVGGAFIAIGLATRLLAVLCAGTMAVAYFQFHVGSDWGGWNWLPIVNRGDLAVLYCFVFLLIAARGPGPLAVDNHLAFARRWR
ncbi:MAG: DoxX family protein [Kofleriaceae bacterium]